jgi:hypothetical protein
LVGKTFFKEKVYINQLVSRTGKLPPLLLSLPWSSTSPLGHIRRWKRFCSLFEHNPYAMGGRRRGFPETGRNLELQKSTHKTFSLPGNSGSRL